jgi:hypothetical protein
VATHASSWSLWPLHEELVPQDMNEKEKVTWGHWCKTNLCNQIFSHEDKGMYNLCKYNAQGLWKSFVVFHHHSCEGLLNQNMQWLQNSLAQTIFFLRCQLWLAWLKSLAIELLVSCNFFFATKHRCVDSICVFKGIMPFVMVYLMNPFLIMELSWFRMLPTTC